MANREKQFIPVLEKTTLKPAQGSGRIIQVILNSDLRAGHLGLSQVAKKLGIQVRDLEPGQYVVFVNSARNRVKIYASHEVIAYWKAARGEQINLKTLRHIPNAFRAKGSLHYEDLLKTELEQNWKMKPNSRPIVQPQRSPEVR